MMCGMAQIHHICCFINGAAKENCSMRENILTHPMHDSNDKTIIFAIMDVYVGFVKLSSCFIFFCRLLPIFTRVSVVRAIHIVIMLFVQINENMHFHCLYGSFAKFQVVLCTAYKCAK